MVVLKITSQNFLRTYFNTIKQAKILQRSASSASSTSTDGPNCSIASRYDPSERVPGQTSAKVRTRFGGRHIVTMLPGEGVGPELMVHLKDIFKEAGAPVDFEEIEMVEPSQSDEENSDPGLEHAIVSIKRNGVGIKASIETRQRQASKISARNVALRNALNLHVNVLRYKNYPGVCSKQSNVDIVIIRQNTEGEYAMLEHENVTGVVEHMKIVTRQNAEKLARHAFEFAKINNRKMVTTIHKANIMKLSDGLFLETARRVAQDYPEIKHNDMLIDNCCMQLVTKPQQFDVLLMTNLYGSIVSNMVCGLLGGSGLFSGKNYGDKYAVFEPATRKAGTSIAGQNVANPVAMLNAGVDMLKHLGYLQHACIIKNAVDKTLADGIHTFDLGGCCSTTDVINSILENISKSDVQRVW